MSGEGSASTLPAARPVAVELRRVRVPLREPIVAAHGTESERRVVIVRAVGADGAEGWGECDALAWPTYTPEWHDGAWLVLRDVLVPAVLAERDPGVVGHPMAAAAIEAAVVDLGLRREGRSLAAALGAVRTHVASRAVVGIAPSVDDALGAVERRVHAGHRAVKVKVRPGDDVEVLRAVRSSWPDLDLAADANGSYDLDGARRLLAAVEPLGLDHLEQPLRAPDLLGHAELRRGTGVPIALDESAPDLVAVRLAVDLGAADAVNVKPARLGGVIAAVAARDHLASRSVRAFCGGMYELGVGRAASLAVAALPGLDAAADLGPSSAYVDRDITEPFELGPDGTLEVPAGVGVGRVPDLGLLDGCTVEVARLTGP